VTVTVTVPIKTTGTKATSGSISSPISSTIGAGVVEWSPPSVSSSTPTAGAELGTLLGKPLGDNDGEPLGEPLGEELGPALGVALGPELGEALGEELGPALGAALGKVLGVVLGKVLGVVLGEVLGAALGEAPTISGPSTSEPSFMSEPSLPPTKPPMKTPPPLLNCPGMKEGTKGLLKPLVGKVGKVKRWRRRQPGVCGGLVVMV
jgi:hypothetical protein